MKGMWFCERHANGLKGRVPCPLDCRHHIKLSTVGSHVLVCEKSLVCPISRQSGKSVAVGMISRARREEEAERKANEHCKDLDAVKSLKRKLEVALSILLRKESGEECVNDSYETRRMLMTRQ